MPFNHTLSAILRGAWLLEPAWAQQHAVLAFKFLKGEVVDFGQSQKNELKEGDRIANGVRVGIRTDLSSIPSGTVAIIDLIGPIIRYSDACTYGLEDMAELVRRVDRNPNISAIVFNVNSPGGEASGTASFAKLVRNITKPTIGIVDDGIAASAAMWIISACDEIYATNTLSHFGSIGAYTVLADYAAYYEKQGLPIHQIYAPQSEDKNKDYNQAMTGDYAGIQAGLAELVDGFIADVKSNRATKLKSSANPFTGKMYNATEAKEIGLIDGFLSLDQAIDRAQNLANKSHTKNMSTNKYPAIASAAGWVEYECTQEGIHLTHSDAEKIEAAFVKNAADMEELTKTNADLITAQKASAIEAAEQRKLAEKYGAESAEMTRTAGKAKDKAEEVAKEFHPVTSEAMKLYARNRSKA